MRPMHSICCPIRTCTTAKHSDISWNHQQFSSGEILQQELKHAFTFQLLACAYSDLLFEHLIHLHLHYITYTRVTAADLGMFSMFGRTEAPTKRGPHKRSGEFLHAGNNERVNESDEQKRSPVFFNEKRVYHPRWRVPHLFSEEGPAESKSGLYE